MVGTGVQAMEPGAPCVKAYAQTQARIEETRASINEVTLTQAGIGALSVGGIKFCAAGTLPVLGGCVVVLGAANLGVYGYRRSLTNQLARLESQNQLYRIYEAFMGGRAANAAEVRELMQEAGVDLQKEDRALTLLADAMESGRLCSRGYARVDFEGWVSDLKSTQF
jgi:hypothetical protein